MAEVLPFRGWRYDLGQVGSLADVTAPPYDVIGPDEQKELYEKHPCNVVRLILNRDEPGDDSSNARYERSANFIRQWSREGVLLQEHEDAFYVYHQEFDWEGQHYLRKGFLCRVRLEEFGEGQIFPHEQTMSGPKADRLALTQACQMNLSPIFSLYPDIDAQAPLENVLPGQTALESTDELGVVHRVWPITNREALNSVRELLSGVPLYIADGHHRYETALNYRKSLQEAGKLESDQAPANYVLMHLVGMDDAGLAILPTHRLISGLPDLNSADLKEILGDHFELESLGSGPDASQKTWELMEADGGQNVFGLGTAKDSEWLFARLTDASPMETLAADQSSEWRQLGVSLLHRLILDHLVGGKYPDAERKCRYVHLLDEVNSGLSDSEAQLACLVAPVGIDHVQEIASKFEKMPPKSTFFYPKLLSGLVFNPLT